MDVVGPLPPRPVEEVAVSSVGNVLIIAGLVSNRLYMGQTGLRYSAPPRAVAPVWRGEQADLRGTASDRCRPSDDLHTHRITRTRAAAATAGSSPKIVVTSG